MSENRGDGGAEQETELEQSSRRRTVMEIRASKRPPCDVAAAVARSIALAALKDVQDRHEQRMRVRRICRGAMNAVMFLGKSMPMTAASLLKAMADTANDIGIDPGDAMTWGMQGIADLTMLAGSETGTAIQRQLTKEFMGVEGIYGDFYQRAQAKKWWTK